MSTPPLPSPNAGSPPALAAPPLDPATVFAALGNPLRWQIVTMLADGRTLSASDVAALVRRDFDGVSKHMKVLRDALVLAWRYGEDRRTVQYFILEKYRTEPGVVDYGFCRLRLPVTGRSPA